MTFTLRRDVTATDTEDGMVLLDEASGRYWQLNGTAAHVLRALLAGASETDAARGLVADYPGLAVEQVARDVGAVLTSLRDAGLVISR